jgi:hypothetical protein
MDRICHLSEISAFTILFNFHRHKLLTFQTHTQYVQYHTQYVQYHTLYLPANALQSASYLAHATAVVVTGTVLCLTADQFKHLTRCVSDCAVSYILNVFLFMICCDFCLLAEQFCDKILNARNYWSHMQIADRLRPATLSAVLTALYCRRWIPKYKCLVQIPRRGRREPLLTQWLL